MHLAPVRRRVLARAALLVVPLVVAAAGSAAHAAAFTPGNLVVSRIGTGAAPVGATLANVFVDEYTTAGAASGNSVALPTATSGANYAITLSGTSTSAGFLTRSVDRTALTIFGYDAAPAATTGSTANRTVAFIDDQGNVDTTTRIAAAGTTPRSAAAVDGTGVYVASDTGSGSTGGTRYIPRGGTAGTLLTGSNFNTNNRVVNIYDGQLYVSASVQSGSTTSPPVVSHRGVNRVGTGTPTTGNQTTTIEIGGAAGNTGQADGTYDFAFASDTVAYLADDSTGAPGIQKWSFDGTAWVKLWNVTPAGTTGLRGLTLDVDALGNVALYGITAIASGPNTLVALDDTLAATAAPAATDYALLATAPTNTVFRGVDFAPVPEPTTLALAAGAAVVSLRRRR